jgi:hypothetical protein
VLQGELGGRSLAIAPGATLSATRGSVVGVAPLTGSVDCTSYRFEGAVGDMTLTSANGPVATFYGSQPMTAQYDGDTASPSLVEGLIPPTDAGADLGPCTWSVQLEK